MATSPAWKTLKDAGVTSPEALLKRHGMIEPSIDVIGLAQAVDVPVFFFPNDERYKGTDGLLVVHNGKARIFVNAEKSKVRQRFTVAHELGHLFLHNNGENSVSFRNDGVLNTLPYDPKKEREANDFAARLLMPEQLIRAYAHMLKPEEMSLYFDVSSPAMKYRLSNIFGRLASS